MMRPTRSLLPSPLMPLVVLLSLSPARADTSLRTPEAPSPSQALIAAKRMWSAVRTHEPRRIARTVGAQVHVWAALMGMATDDNYEVDVERDRFAQAMTTLQLGDLPADDWQLLTQPPLTTTPQLTWVSASVIATSAAEGHRAQTGALAFGVRLVGGRAMVVAFNVAYGESRGPVFKR